MKLSQEQIDKISKVLERTTGIIALVSVILMLILPKGAVGSWFVWTFIGLFFGFAILTGITKNWATDEEAEEKKKLIKEAIHEIVEEQEQSLPTVVPKHEVYDPFAVDVTDEQKDIIKQILRDLPSHREKRDCINMSEVSRYLTALEELKIITPSKSADTNSLRTWVEQVTGKQAPEQFRFNDAFPSTNKPGIKKAKEKIKQILEI